MATRKTDPKPETVLEHIEEICGRCWPNGWPHQSHSASCEHGTYVRDAAPDADGDQGTVTKVATADTKKTAEDAPPAGESTGA